jgi:uncharacterized protein YycO
MRPIIVKKELKTGDVLICQGSSWTSKVIQWFIKGWPSHAGIIIECWGQPYVVDAQANGVNPKPFDAWMKEYNYKVRVLRTNKDFDSKALSIKAFSRVGLTGYDYISLLLKSPWYWLTGRWKKVKNSEDKMYCSEYVAWCLDIDEEHKMNPQQLYVYLLRLPDYKEYEFVS